MKRRFVLMATALVKNRGQYLLLRRSKNNRTDVNKWQFPEGKTDFGETPIETLKRELKEETNLNLINAKLLGWYSSVTHYPGLGTGHQIRLLYKCKISGKVEISEEHDDFGWFDLNGIRKLDLAKNFDFKDVRKVLEELT